MIKGDKIKIPEMGFMGLETYYATFISDLDETYCLVDLGRPCILEGQIRKIHKSRIQTV